MIETKCRQNTAKYAILHANDHDARPITHEVVPHLLERSEATSCPANSLLLDWLGIQEHFHRDKPKDNVHKACCEGHKEILWVVKIVGASWDVSYANSDWGQDEVCLGTGDSTTFLDKFYVLYSFDSAWVDINTALLSFCDNRPQITLRRR